MYQETEKPLTQIKLAVCEDGQDRQTKHVQEVQGNFVVDLSSFSFILEEMAVCRDCEVGNWSYLTVVLRHLVHLY